MKKSVSILLILFLMILSVALSSSTKAESQGHLTINSDGSVTPSTTSIQQTGDVYSLNRDVTESIWIYKSNIIFDGNGHTVSEGTIYILGVSNVTVRNLTITDSYQGISMADSSGVIITNDTIRETGASLPFSETWAISIQRGNSSQIVGNSIIDNMVGVSFAESFGNLIIGNDITDCSSVAFGLYNSSYNRIYHNNIVNNSLQFKDEGIGLYPYRVSTNIWDKGSISGGNYWGDYKLKYPDSTEINHSGIWNISYVLDQNNIDHFPLAQQVDITQTSPTSTVPEFSLLAGIPVFVVVLCVAITIKHRKTIN